MLTGIHFLLTYACTSECDHCFLYCSPRAEGTFTIAQIKTVLAEASEMGTVEWIYFEGGEPFLFFPLMVEGLRMAGALGFKTGVVTNCYWATAEEDAALWLNPVQEIGIHDLSLSDDEFHHGDVKDSPAKFAFRAARNLGVPSESICIEKPAVTPPQERKGDPVIGGGALFKGRAADTLTEGLPTQPLEVFTECTHEELKNPTRVHIDSFGNVHVCQGISIGNMWTTPLPNLIADYTAADHPICGPLVRGGPAELVRTYDCESDGYYVDECHACFSIRRGLMNRFPDHLAPPQVYGVNDT